MSKKWSLGNLFHKEENDAANQEVSSQGINMENKPEGSGKETEIPVENIVYLPEAKGALLSVWEHWAHMQTAPLLTLNGSVGAQGLNLDAQMLERERVRIIVQLEQDAKKRLHEIEKGKEIESYSLNSSCHVYLSKDKMAAWIFFFPPFGPDGKFEAASLGKALQSAGVTTGIDSSEVVRILQEQPQFELIPIAAGTAPQEGKHGKVIELYARELPVEVIVDEDGIADYRTLNYVRQIDEGTHICNIIPPKEGTPGVQVDGKIVEPKPVKAAKVPKGVNTVISEDGLHLVAARDGHLEFVNDAFHVRPLLEIKGDVDYSTGNIEFNGDVHVHGDVREGFEVHATGTVTVDGLVEAATVEAGGDLIISRGVVGDHRALLRSKGCVRVKYLENCVLYAGKTVFADCIMTSQIFSDDAINVTSGRGSVIGGAMTAAHSIRARMIGAQSGRRTELTLGVLPYVQTELLTIEEELKGLHTEMSRLERDIEYLEKTEGMDGSSSRLAKAKMRRSVLSMKERKLVARKKALSPLLPDLSKCRLECDMVYPVTTLTIQNRIWVAKEVRRRCRIIFDVNNEELREIF